MNCRMCLCDWICPIVLLLGAKICNILYKIPIFLADINECSSSSLNLCSQNANCTNTQGGYVCACLAGYNDTSTGAAGTVCDGKINLLIQVNLDMTDSMGPGKLARHMQNPSYTYNEYLICIKLGPSISSVICKNPSYSGPSYPSSPVLFYVAAFCPCTHVFLRIQRFGVVIILVLKN